MLTKIQISIFEQRMVEFSRIMLREYSSSKNNVNISSILNMQSKPPPDEVF